MEIKIIAHIIIAIGFVIGALIMEAFCLYEIKLGLGISKGLVFMIVLYMVVAIICIWRAINGL